MHLGDSLAPTLIPRLAPRAVEIPDRVWRVALIPSGERFSRITPDDALLRDAGNRFDVPGGGVLYCATNPRGAYLETLAGKRVSAKMAALVQHDPTGFMPPNSVPASWRDERRLFTVGTTDPACFIDVEDLETRQYIVGQIGEQLEQLGIETLDVPDVRGMNRLLTREIARWAYSSIDEEGDYAYSGIRYVSKLDNEECWAIFGGTETFIHEQTTIEKTDPHLVDVARLFRLTIH